MIFLPFLYQEFFSKTTDLHFCCLLIMLYKAFQVAQCWRICLLIQVTQETWVWSLGQEDSQEKEMETNSNILAWKTLGREAWWTTAIGSQRVRYDWAHIHKNQTHKEKCTGIHQFSLVARLRLTLCDPRTAACQASCPSPTPKAGSSSCPLSQWCHPTISSSVIPFSSCLQSFPASGSLPMSQFFASDGQSAGVSASASVLPMNIQDWFPLGWTGWISLQSKGLSRVFSNTTVQKHQFFCAQLSLQSNSHIHAWLLENPWLCLDGPLSASTHKTYIQYTCIQVYIKCLKSLTATSTFLYSILNIPSILHLLTLVFPNTSCN